MSGKRQSLQGNSKPTPDPPPPSDGKGASGKMTAGRGSGRPHKRSRSRLDAGDFPSGKRRRCDKSGCNACAPICFANSTEKCVGNGYTSRWYHMSAGEHYCNECFETFYRTYKDGFPKFAEWKTKWSSNGKTDPSMKTFMADVYLPFWVQCTKSDCEKWRQLPNNMEMAPEFIREFECDKLNTDGGCSEPEDPRVCQAKEPRWIETLVLAPMMKNSPAAQFLGAYYPDGVGMSPTCSNCINANAVFQENRKNTLSKMSDVEAACDIKLHNSGIVPTTGHTFHIPGLNPNFQPFYQPTEQGKALCVRPDVMEYDEEQEFKEYAREQVMYLAIRNLIVAMWNLDCKRWLHLEDVASHLVCRGLVRIRCILESERILRFLTKKGIINTGLLRVPRGQELVKEDLEDIVVIVGAGVSGLAAARQLTNFGIKVKVVEARNRIGGRIHDHSLGGVAVGRGAQIVTGVINNPITMMCEQAGFPMRYLGDRCDLYSSDGKPTDPELDKKIDFHFNSLLDTIAEWRKNQPEDVSLHDKLWEMHKEFLEDTNSSFTEDQMKVFMFHLSNLKYACGSNLKQVSALNWDQNENFAQFAGDHTLLTDGYMTLLQRLAEGVEVKLNTEIKRIDYSQDVITLSTSSNETIEASRVLVTLPLSLLQNGDVQFDPGLPENKLKALTQLGAGVIEKVAIRFPVRFWDSQIQGADFFGYVPPTAKHKGQFVVFCDMNPQCNDQEEVSHVLMTYLCGEATHLVEEKSDLEIVEECVQVLKGIFKNQVVPEPLSYFVTRWSQDKYSKMAYSYVKIKGSGEAYDILAEDVQQKLFFAGEATNRYFPQTVTGAYLSGVREASKILKSLTS